MEPLRDRYDYVLLDTSPSLGALNINAMAAADEVVITVNPQLLAMMGIAGFFEDGQEDKTSSKSKTDSSRDSAHHVRLQDKSLQGNH